MQRSISLILCAALLAASLGGCAPAAPAQAETEAEPAQTAEPLRLVPCTDFSPAADFGMRLFAQTLRGGDENPVISPVSAYLCLSMVMLGAESETLAEFEALLGGDTQGVVSLSHDLRENLEDTAGSSVMHIANSLWTDDDKVVMEPAFVRNITDFFDGEIHKADLPSREALADINAWVNEKTEGLIPSLHDTPYPENTAAVLLNSLYMKAKWARVFEGHDTRNDTFTKADGSAPEVPFMHMFAKRQQYIGTGDAEGVLLPYDDGKTAFLALRPTDGRTARDFAATLTAEGLAGYVDAAEDRLVHLSMPKFNLAYEFYLTDALQAMGLGRVFSPDTAELAAMGRGAGGPLFLNWVFQKVKIEVNEEGTEAAAVTEALMLTGSAMPAEEPVILHLDSPFVYAVLDLESGAPLFLGLLDNPAAE